jgi:ribonuclease VapC
MIVDTSALIAILFNEDDAPVYANELASAAYCGLSAASYLEAGINVDAQASPAAGRQLDILIEQANITIEPVTPRQARLARQAYVDFGKGRHPAKLNYGDCFSYALAKDSGKPLLFKGNDFSRTDITSKL